MKPLHDQRGVTYLMVMAAIVLMGVAMTVVGQQWSIMVKRDKEAKLLFRRNRIKAALEAYAADYQVCKATWPTAYPVKLEQLTEMPKRYLQVACKDPITGGEFELIKAGAEILGVRSPSKAKPLNTVDFKDAATYNAIRFEVKPDAAQPCLPGAATVNPLNPLGVAPCPPPGQTAAQPLLAPSGS
jgi:type II secretory pathway pseudopilin PulG